MAKRRTNRTGSFWYDKKQRRWLGEIILPTESGKLTTFRRSSSLQGRKGSDAVKEKIDDLLQELSVHDHVSSNSITVREHLENWLKHQESRLKIGETTRRNLEIRGRTFNGYSYIINKHLVPSLGHIPRAKLTTGDIQIMIDHKRHLANTTLKKFKTILGAAYNWPKGSKHSKSSPVHGVEISGQAMQKPEPWDVEETKAFLEAIKGHQYEAMLFINVFGGQRQSELVGLQWKNLDLDKRVMHIRSNLQRNEKTNEWLRDLPKSDDSQREVPLSDSVISKLKEHRAKLTTIFLQQPPHLKKEWQKWDLVFPNSEGRPIDSSNLRRMFYAICKQNGLRQIKPQWLRNGANSLMNHFGEDLHTRRQILGHSDIRMTDRYTTVYAEKKAGAIDRLSEKLAAND
jgi:integrase